MSVTHPAHFILVGTMNPEEGELRPQLLDRFGLCVDVTPPTDIDQRLCVMELEREFLDNPQAVHRTAAPRELELYDRLQAATTRLDLVQLPDAIRALIARLCLDGSVAGHRADLVVARTARAICALRGAALVGRADVLEALELALAHRRRDAATDKPEQAQELASRAAEQLAQIQATTPTETAEAARGEATQQEGASGGESNEGWTTAEARESPSTEAVEVESDAVIQLRTFTVKKLDLPRERQARRAAGKRTSTKSETKRGRYVRSSQAEKVTDVAFDATVRAAAPHQLRRRQATPDAPNQLQLESQDLRQKVRERKTGNLIVFVVDASASMDAEQRMMATRGAILSLLRHAYVRRDKVALVAFSGRSARIVLRPTASVDLAERRMERLNIGGTTPLTHGLVTALKLIKTERLRDPHVYPLLVLISDGRGNISLFGEEPLLEAQRCAAQIKSDGIRAMVIDSTRDFSHQPGHARSRIASLYGAYAFNVCGDLAEQTVVSDCPYHCDPDASEALCPDCRERIGRGETLPRARRRMRVVELPINASEDRVVGAIDIEAAIKSGERRFEPGVLAEANRNILYVDEVNLLDDHLVDVLLDAAAMGVNVVEREGISIWHPARFILVGTMNPEETRRVPDRNPLA